MDIPFLIPPMEYLDSGITHAFLRSIIILAHTRQNFNHLFEMCSYIPMLCRLHTHNLCYRHNHCHLSTNCFNSLSTSSSACVILTHFLCFRTFNGKIALFGVVGSNRKIITKRAEMPLTNVLLAKGGYSWKTGDETHKSISAFFA